MLPLLASWACLLLLAPLLAWTRHPGAALRTVLPVGLAGRRTCVGAAGFAAMVRGRAVGRADQPRRHRRGLREPAPAQPLREPHEPRLGSACLDGSPVVAAGGAGSGHAAGLRQCRVRVAHRPAAVADAQRPGCGHGRAAPRAAAGVRRLWPPISPATWLLPVVLQHWRGVEATNVFRACGGTGVQQPARAVVQRAAPDRATPWTGWGAGELDYAHFVTLYPGAASATSWTTPTTCRCTSPSNFECPRRSLLVALLPPSCVWAGPGGPDPTPRSWPGPCCWRSACTACWNTRSGTARSSSPRCWPCRNDELALLAVRFEAAFPDRYKAWRAAHGLPPIATPRARE
jgi:hypothetical protein